MKKLPEFKNINGRWSFVVDDCEMILYSGELHNSSASSLEYMDEQIWPALRNLHMNSVIASVSWELFEPAPGEYDFSLVQGLIEGARREGMKLIFLWFGVWKNTFSTYAPEWIKNDQETYFLTQPVRPPYTISPFCQAAVDADARAFAALMGMIRDFDAEEQTVLLMQVENEIGVLGAARDHSAAADAAFRQPIPDCIAALYNKSEGSSWSDAFGADADEYFMEYRYATIIEQIAQAGRAEYALPMYVNAWLEQFPQQAGKYPSGGPIARFIPLWKRVAPSIVALAPDIYVSDFHSVCSEYTMHGNPLLIPEHRRDLRYMSNVIYAMGIGALMFAPFGVEELGSQEGMIEKADAELMKSLNIAYESNNSIGSDAYLARAYDLLSSMETMLREHRASGHVHAFMRESNHQRGTLLPLSRYDAEIIFQDQEGNCAQTAGIIIETSENEFYVAGNGFSYRFISKSDSLKHSETLRLEEGKLVNNRWKRGRVLNGDEGVCTRFGNYPAIQRIVMMQFGA